jgi:light-regulated signal transduction histidine kinase (bacteriophytochrome)
MEETRQLILLLASRAIHEVAGPIDQISSLVALFLRRYRGKIDADADTLLSHIEAARSRLGNTAAGIRKCLQACTAGCGRAPVDTSAILAVAIASLSKEASECDAELLVGDLPVVEGDQDLLLVLFQNLLDNAVKFRRPDVRPRVEISGVESPDGSLFQVRDNGIGIEPRNFVTVFEPFRKLNGPQFPGAGLGLALAQMIVEFHGGRIWIDPTESGTQVSFELPATK